MLFVPIGMAGVLMLHAPAWRARRVGRLAGPYLVAGVCGLVAAVGVIGLLEMLHALVAADTPSGVRRLFWTAVSLRSVLPWLVFTGLAAAGALGLRWAGPRAAAAFADANRAGAGR